MNKKAIKILNNYLNNNEDYEKVKLTPEQNQYLYNKCADIKVFDDNETEDQLWYMVEITLHRVLIDLGYTFCENTYKWAV